MRRRPIRDGEQGSIIPLVLGLFLIVVTMLALVVDVTAAHLGRTRAMDAADAAARDAADAIATEGVYEGGVGPGRGLPALTDATVAASAAELLASLPVPPGVVEWHVDGETGTPEGRTAVVTVVATVRLPMSNALLPVEGVEVVRVQARAVAVVR